MNYTVFAMVLTVLARGGISACGGSGGGGGMGPPTLSGIRISPAGTSIDVSASQGFSATAVFSDGSTSNVNAVWSAPDGGTVSQQGFFLPPSSPCICRVVAVQQGGSFADTALVEVTASPPPDPNYPHQPAGFSKLAYSTFTTTASITNDGWSGSDQAPLPTIATETPGPDALMATPGSFGRATYGSGFLSGDTPVHFFRDDLNKSQIYGSYWMRRSLNFVYEQSGVNKLTFVWFGDHPTFFLNEDQRHLSFWLQNQATPAGENSPNVGSGSFSQGVWHRVEYLVGNDNVRVWLDGIKIIDRNVNLGGSVAQKVEWAPYWGGNTGQTVPSAQYLDIDDYYISGH